MRNRIIQYWEWLSNSDSQKSYQEAVPYVSVSNEAINQWQDWQPYDSPKEHFHLPVFTPDEVAMIDRFHRVWNEVCDATPDPMPPLEELQDNWHWKRLMKEAKSAYDLFMRRGLMDEENLLAAD